MIGRLGAVGRIGLSAGARVVVITSPDFTLSNAAVTTAWGTVQIGALNPVNAPAGVTFRVVNEPAGLAVVNG